MKQSAGWYIAFFVLLLGYSLFSYSLTDPNLVISQNEAYWQFQEWMWHTFFHNAHLLTGTFVALVSALFVVYLAILKQLAGQQHAEPLPFPNWRLICVYALLICPLFFSYNALSHDVFNYMFNARMVLKYQANPHVKTAIEFVYFDDWTRFMHNTHTPAPYGYGWTALSLVPSYLGGERFLPTWLLFRVMGLIGLAATYFLLQGLSKALHKRYLTPAELGLFFLNPLILIELVGNMHNDVWMLIPAAGSLWVLTTAIRARGMQRYGWWLLSLLLLAGSVVVKFATLTLVPLWAVLLMGQMKASQFIHKLRARFALPEQLAQSIIAGLENRITAIAPAIASVLLFLPLFTERSQRFLPWYLVWSLIWLPLISWRWWRYSLLAFTLSSLWRYAPALWNGGYTPIVTFQERLISWGVALVCISIVIGRDRRRFRFGTSAGKTSLRRIE